jgi:hypothetical protein
VAHVVQLAHLVAAGRTGQVADLIASATALEDAGDAAGPASPYGRRSGRMIVTGDQQADFRNRIAGPARGYMATTSGELRRLFPPRGEWTTEQALGGWCLNLLPTQLPAEDDTPVAIYGSSYMVSSLLWKIGRGDDTTKTVERIIGRVVHRWPRPWEDWLQYRAD